MNANGNQSSAGLNKRIIAGWLSVCPMALLLATNVLLLAESRQGVPGPTGQTTAVAPVPGGTKGGTDRRDGEGVSVRARDPFKLPISVFAQGKGARRYLYGPPLPGKRGLIIQELKLQGIVSQQSDSAALGGASRGTPLQMIAVVTGGTKLAYFLHVNDVVYDGVVTRIAPDSVFFRESYLDAEGKVQTREVVKRLDSVPAEAK